MSDLGENRVLKKNDKFMYLGKPHEYDQSKLQFIRKHDLPHDR